MSEASWKPDPYGRYKMRYFDGSAWTEHVVDGGGTQLVDPLGRSTATPIVLPTAATGGPSSGRSPWPPPDPTSRRA